jgi:hypothetical protein
LPRFAQQIFAALSRTAPPHLAAILLIRPPMTRARNHGKRLTARALSRFCAAWIVLLALSSSTTPFSVYRGSEIAGVSWHAQWPRPYRHDYENLALEGVAISIEPTVPVATTIGARATAVAVDIDPSPAAEPPAAAQPAPLAPREATILVLRV